MVDTQLCYLFFNSLHARAMETLYGTTPRPGLCLLDLIPQKDHRDAAARNLEAALGGQTVIEETPYPEESPPAFCYRVSHIPVSDEAGNREGVLVTALDITLEKAAQRKLVHSERRLHEALEASEIASWSYNGTTGETQFSDRYYTMLGYRPGAFPATLESWIGLIHPDDAEATVGSFRYYIQTKTETFQTECRMRTSAGGWKWILGQAKVVERNDHGLPVRVAGTNTDITQRKLAEAALRESESRWTNLVDMAPIGISLIGPRGIVQFINRQEALFRDSTALGRDWKEFLPRELHDQADRVIEAGFERGESQIFHTWNLRASGEVCYFENHVSPILEDGGVSALMIVSIDETASKQVSERRKKASRRFEILLSLHDEALATDQALFDAALDAAVELTDSQIGYVYFYSEETQVFTLHAWSRSVMEQCRVMDPQVLYHLERTGYWGEAVRQRRPILVNDFQRPSEYHRGMPEGHVPLRRFLTIPVFDNNQIVAVIGVGNKAQPYTGDDIDELNLLATSLWQLLRRRESDEARRRLHHAVEHAPVSILITDPSGAITYANPKFLTLTGYHASEVWGRNPGFLRSGTVPREVYADLWATILAGKEWQGELVNRKKDGSLLTELVSISPVLDAEGHIASFIGVKEDITERQATQDLLLRSQKMETVGQLAAGVAHDFNNLLTSVLGYNQMLLLKLKPGDPLRTYAEKLEISGQRAATLVAGLLAVGRRQKMNPVSTDLNAFLAEEEPLLTSMVHGRAELTVSFSPDPVSVLIDPGQLSQVLVNLVSNAKDALESGGRITLSLGKETHAGGTWASIKVEDNGPGIPRELKEKVFEPFFTTKSIGKGTGMGLAIVQGVVQQLSGTISLETCSPEGARFVIRLPLE